MTFDPRATVAGSLWDGQVRGHAPNNPTCMGRAVRMSRVLPVRTTQDLFVGAYARIADRCRAIDEPGLAVVAVDQHTGEAAGMLTLCARVGRPVSAIIGRHDRCDLFLHRNEQLSLRHLALVLEPVASWERGPVKVRYRLLDLRTSEGMIDESGKPLRGLLADGPAIVRVGGYALFVLPVGDPSDWPASGADAWSILPARMYLDEHDLAQGTAPRFQMPRAGARETYITRTSGPRDTGMRLAQGDLAGVLELFTPHRQLSLSIGHAALRDGVLLGRYQRCDMTEVAGEDHSLSRVHALLIASDERLVLVDTATTNGTFERGEPARLVIMDGHTELRLGKRTFARWRAVS